MNRFLVVVLRTNVSSIHGLSPVNLPLTNLITIVPRLSDQMILIPVLTVHLERVYNYRKRLLVFFHLLPLHPEPHQTPPCNEHHKGIINFLMCNQKSNDLRNISSNPFLHIIRKVGNVSYWHVLLVHRNDFHLFLLRISPLILILTLEVLLVLMKNTFVVLKVHPVRNLSNLVEVYRPLDYCDPTRPEVPTVPYL